jgi:hypothetical protein
MKKFFVILMMLFTLSAFAEGIFKPVDFIGKTVQDIIQVAGCPGVFQDASNGYLIIAYQKGETTIRFLAYQNIIFYYDILQKMDSGETNVIKRYEKPKI